MALPALIEIVPLAGPVQADITVPGSKSITNRALVLAALADGEVTLEGALWSEDTQVMVECLQKLGFDVRVELDRNEFCNRTITVKGRGGEIPRAGTPAQPLPLFVGNAGTAARFLAAMVCLGRGAYRLSGVPRMHQRPQAALFQALRELGYRVDSENEKLPAVIHGTGPSSELQKAQCRVSIDESSQFASALLLAAKRGRWWVVAVGDNAEESPYVAMTAGMLSAFPHAGGRFQIEPDASSGSYFWAASSLAPERVLKPVYREPDGRTWEPTVAKQMSDVTVRHWPRSGWQIDSRFPGFLLPNPAMLPASTAVAMADSVSRKTDLGDSIMTAIVVAPFLPNPVRFSDLGRLRVQECERVTALRTELTRCGAEVVELGDTLVVSPSAERMHGAEIETYNDHRMAMCFAVVGLKIPGIRLQDPGCVKKTFPNFFQKLAAAPPHGLGVRILDGKSGRALTGDDLFAA